MSLDVIPPGVDPVVQAVATDMGRRYAAFGADRDDMHQQCLLWVLDHPEKLEQFLANEDYGIKQLARTLRNECHDYGEQVKAQFKGYSIDDLYYYHKAEVRSLLDAMFDQEAWTEPPVSDGGPTGRRDPATGGGWVATLADVAQGFNKLKAADRDLLSGFHCGGWNNKMMAEAAGVSEQTMSYRHDSAVKRLVDILGGPRPRSQHDEDCRHVWTGRRAISNSHARALTEGQYDDE